MTDWPGRTIAVSRRRLPHWTTEEGTYFVTFRLADALTPAEAWHVRQQRAAHRDVDDFLDRGRGRCWLRDARVATIVDNAIRFFDERRYAVHAWTIMPNHVHLALRLARGIRLRDILKTLKGFTGREANTLLGRRGAFWQEESYDTLLHDQNDLNRVLQYIVENPIRARLTDWPWTTVLRREFQF